VNPPVALRRSGWQSRSEPYRLVNQLVDVEMSDAGRITQALPAALVDLLEQRAPNWYDMAHWMNWKARAAATAPVSAGGVRRLVDLSEGRT
jgi:hypothetical protein